MIQISRSAGYHAPEFLDSRLAFTVRFFAEGYTAPTRISHDLTELQREILRTLQRIGPNSSVVIAEHLSSDVDQRLVLRNLQTLREFGLVFLMGERRGARWRLVF
jgi:predicted transcriptional regulator